MRASMYYPFIHSLRGLILRFFKKPTKKHSQPWPKRKDLSDMRFESILDINNLFKSITNPISRIEGTVWTLHREALGHHLLFLCLCHFPFNNSSVIKDLLKFLHFSRHFWIAHGCVHRNLKAWFICRF